MGAHLELSQSSPLCRSEMRDRRGSRPLSFWDLFSVIDQTDGLWGRKTLIF